MHRRPRQRDRSSAREIAIGMRQLTGTDQRAVRDRKRAYPSKAKAKEYAALLSRKHGTTAYPYECPDCGGWHLTTMRPEQYRAMRRGGGAP